MSRIRIGITQGDTNGIGYEIIIKAFAHPEMLEICTPVVYGNEKVAHYHRQPLEADLENAPNFVVVGDAAEARDGQLNLLNTSVEECTVEYGKCSAAAGRQAQAALNAAFNDWKQGKIDAVVTAPICKAAIHSDSFPYAGHTEYFEKMTESEGLMILCNEQMRVALATTHLPVKDIAAAIDAELLKKKIRLLHTTLVRDFCISSPRIAVLALNPHCGENGNIGSEEAEIIAPCIEELRKNSIPCFGPYAADAFFGEGFYRQFDAVLAMYHDQGLAPFKALGMESGVNYTAGLPIVRTSPAHGTAFDIAGQGKASADSMRQAIYAAIDIVRHRTTHDTASANPLPFSERRIERERLPIHDPRPKA